jgi:hypothetical protein
MICSMRELARVLPAQTDRPVKVDTAPRLKGRDLVRAAVAQALAKGPGDAERIASTRWGSGSTPELYIKAATSGITAGDLVTGGAAVPAEFFAAAIERSALGKMGGALRRVPFRTRCVPAASGTTAFWLGEGKAAGITKAALDFTSLAPKRVAAYTIATEEALTAAGEAIEAGLRLDLLRALAAAMNTAMFDPLSANPAAPASLLDGAPNASVPGSWGDARDFLLASFTGDLEGAWLAISPRTAALATHADRPDVGARGGSLWGVPVATGTGIPDGIVALLDPNQIAFAQAGGEIKASREAAVQAMDNPTNDSVSATPVATDLVSLWQTNSVALGVDAHVNWQVIGSGNVAWVDVSEDA